MIARAGRVMAIALLLASACATADESAADSFARFAIEVRAPVAHPKTQPTSVRAMPVAGMLELDAREESACLQLAGAQFTIAKLGKGPESVASFSLGDSVGGDICQRNVAKANLQRVIEEWEDYSLTVVFPGEVLSRSALRYIDQTG